MEYPFKYADGGRKESKRSRQRNDCTVRALAMVANLDYDVAYDILKDRGRMCSTGYHFPLGNKYKKEGALPEAGVRFEWLSFQPKPGETRMTVERFSREYAEGAYVARVSKHVYAMIDGVVHDTHRHTGAIYGAWKVIPIT